MAGLDLDDVGVVAWSDARRADGEVSQYLASLAGVIGTLPRWRWSAMFGQSLVEHDYQGRRKDLGEIPVICFSDGGVRGLVGW